MNAKLAKGNKGTKTLNHI